MEMAITLIILVGVAVVFLTNVFRQAKNEREQAERRSNLPPRRRDSNTERFLEEVNRRRQQASGQAKPPIVVRPATLSPPPSRLPRREPSIRRTAPKTEKPRMDRPASRSVLTPGQLLDVVPVDIPASVPATPEPPPPPARPVAPMRPSGAQVSARPQAFVLRQLLPFLQSKQTLRAGFVLHEILGPPRCRHRGRVAPALTQSHNQHDQAKASAQS
jgi:hypothetical protein